MARGYTKAVEQARTLVYVEDQYLWGNQVGGVFTEALRAHPDLHVIAVVPLHPDVGGVNRLAQLEGRRRAMTAMEQAAPGRVAVYGIENDAGTPIYVHAKTCMVDDTWATIGSDNFNRRSWTHDSELSAVGRRHRRRLRPPPAADAGRRAPRPRPRTTRWTTAPTRSPCSRRTPRAPPRSTPGTTGAGAARGRPVGCGGCARPSSAGSRGRWRRRSTCWAHDPDGRPRSLRRRGEF